MVYRNKSFSDTLLAKEEATEAQGTKIQSNVQHTKYSKFKGIDFVLFSLTLKKIESNSFQS